jgi:hypothetical protein
LEELSRHDILQYIRQQRRSWIGLPVASSVRMDCQCCLYNALVSGSSGNTSCPTGFSMGVLGGTASTFPEMVRYLYRQQTTAFKINLSFGFILRNIETGVLWYYHRSIGKSIGCPNKVHGIHQLKQRQLCSSKYSLEGRLWHQWDVGSTCLGRRSRWSADERPTWYRVSGTTLHSMR